MRRALITMFSVCALTLAIGGTAWAQDPTYPPGSDASAAPRVGGVEGIAGSHGTAFTGGDMTLIVLALGGLFALGAVAFAVGLRRAKNLNSDRDRPSPRGDR